MFMLLYMTEMTNVKQSVLINILNRMRLKIRTHWREDRVFSNPSGEKLAMSGRFKTIISQLT